MNYVRPRFFQAGRGAPRRATQERYQVSFSFVSFSFILPTFRSSLTMDMFAEDARISNRIFGVDNVVVMFPYKHPEDEPDHDLHKPYQFEWKANMNYCLTMKSSLDFECTEATNIVDGDNKFLPFAMRKSGLTVVKYYKFENGADKDQVWMYCPNSYNLFLWNRRGDCVNGAY